MQKYSSDSVIFYYICQGLRRFPGGFPALGLHHDPNQGFCARGAHQNPACSGQLVLPLPYRGLYLRCGHDGLFLGLVRHGDVNEQLGIPAAVRCQLRGLFACAAEQGQKLQGGQLSVPSGGEAAKDGVSRLLPAQNVAAGVQLLQHIAVPHVGTQQP